MTRPTMTPAQVARLRATVEGPAQCPSCGKTVEPELDVCPCDGDGVTVEPLSYEFLEGPPFADRATVIALLALVGEERDRG